MLLPPPKTFHELQKQMEMIHQNRNGMNWYLSFKPNITPILEEKDR